MYNVVYGSIEDSSQQHLSVTATFFNSFWRSIADCIKIEIFIFTCHIFCFSVPPLPNLGTLSRNNGGVIVAFDPPAIGNCPVVKVHTSPVTKGNAGKPAFHKIGQVCNLQLIILLKPKFDSSVWVRHTQAQWPQESVSLPRVLSQVNNSYCNEYLLYQYSRSEAPSHA